jgi:hypothetical protein
MLRTGCLATQQLHETRIDRFMGGGLDRNRVNFSFLELVLPCKQVHEQTKLTVLYSRAMMVELPWQSCL